MARITNKKEFEDWLEDQPKEWAQVLAARIALRTLPMASRMFDAKGLKPDARQKLTFFIFRATSISWFARKHPNHDMRAAAAAAYAAYAAAYVADAAAYAAAAYAAAAAAYAAAAAAAATAATTADDAIAYAAYAAAAAAAAAVWTAIDADAEFLNGTDGNPQAAAKRLAGKGLWLNRRGAISTPKWCLDALDRLEHHLLQLDDNWHVWTQWYSPLLLGQSGWGLSAKNAEYLIVRITTQDEKFWDEGGSKVNAKIARWLEEIRAREDAERKTGDNNIVASTVRAQAEFLLRISPATMLASETIAAQLAAILDKFLNETQQNTLPEELQMFDNIRRTYETFQQVSSPDEQDVSTEERITRLEATIKELHQQISALNEKLAVVNSKGVSPTSKAREAFVVSAAKAAGVAAVAGVGFFLANISPQTVTELAQQVANLKSAAGSTITAPTP